MDKCKIVGNKDSKISCKENIFKLLVFNQILVSSLRTSINMTHTTLLRSQPQFPRVTPINELVNSSLKIMNQRIRAGM